MRDHFALTRTVDATIEPVTLTEAQDHLRQPIEEEIPYINALITAARQHCEAYTQRAFITQTWRYVLDGFPGMISLPRPNLLAVSSIAYTDTNGDIQTIDAADYQVDTYSEPGRIIPAYGTYWPSTRAQMGTVVVTYTAGFGATAALVPKAIKQAMLILIGQWYENREATISGTTIANVPVAWEALLSPYCVAWEA
jgi:uncharacterized phiE125 gp8 family phage protein